MFLIRYCSGLVERMIRTTILMLLLMTANVEAQSSANVPVSTSSTVANSAFGSALPISAVISRPVVSNGWDRSSFAIEAFKWVAVVADIETTNTAVNSRKCRESDFLYGGHPSRLRLYGVMGGAEAVHSFIGYRLRKSGHARKLTKVSALVAGAGHSFAAMSNVHCGEY